MFWVIYVIKLCHISLSFGALVGQNKTDEDDVLFPQPEASSVSELSHWAAQNVQNVPLKSGKVSYFRCLCFQSPCREPCGTSRSCSAEPAHTIHQLTQLLLLLLYYIFQVLCILFSTMNAYNSLALWTITKNLNFLFFLMSNKSSFLPWRGCSRRSDRFHPAWDFSPHTLSVRGKQQRGLHSYVFSL